MSFWSDLDQLMDPLETACIDHPDLTVQNVQVTGIGHLALPVHPAVATGIRQALDTATDGDGVRHARRRPDGGVPARRRAATAFGGQP